MRQLSSLENIIYQVGGIFMLLGAMLYATSFKPYAVYGFVIGAFAFSAMQLRTNYLGDNFTIKRLRRQQIFGALFIMASALCMVNQELHVFYTYGVTWQLLLVIASVFEVFTAFRIPHELKKEEEKNRN